VGTGQDVLVYFGGETIQEGSYGSTLSLSYVTADRLGSMPGGSKLDPYGQEITATANDKVKFATYLRDGESGIDYAMNRYYAAGRGRFLTADHHGGSANNPASWNHYVYAGGDPIGNMDPNGLDYCPVGAGADVCEYMEGLSDADPGGMCVQTAWTFGYMEATAECPGMDGGIYGTGILWEAAQEGQLAREEPPPPQCTISVFTRGVPFAGSFANHTYIEVSDPADGIDEVLEGGPTNPHNPLTHPSDTWGQMVGYIDPVINRVVTGGLKGADPSSNRQLLTETGGSDVCDEVMQLQADVQGYNSGSLVNYAPLPNGTTTFNSNSFTFTLLNQAGLSAALAQATGWSPGWGQLVPGQ
jgi:RHS repeat-associated protein